MNIQQIEYTIAVSKFRNFGQAAEHCFITQSTISTMVGRLEEELGILLFDRKTKPLTVTKEGETVIEQLEVIMSEIENLHQLVSALKGAMNGTLRIGAIPTVAPYLLPLFLYDFIKKYPSIHFEISEIPTGKIMESLKNRSLDIGIVSTPLHDADLLEFPLYNEPFLLFDKGEMPLQKGFQVSEIDLKRLWLLEEGHCMRTQVEKICNLKHERNLNGNLEYKSGTIDTLIKFVNKNKGVTLLPQLATLDLPPQEVAALKTFYEPIPVRTVGLIVHKHFVKHELLQQLKTAIEQKIKPLIQQNTLKEAVILPL